MTQLLARTGKLDRIAIAISGMCLVHCLATAVLFAVVASAGGILGSAVIHEVGLVLAVILGTVALGRGVIEHGFMMPVAIGALGLGVMSGAHQLPHGGVEAVYTMLGAGLLALGHRLNCLAAD